MFRSWGAGKGSVGCVCTVINSVGDWKLPCGTPFSNRISGDSADIMTIIAVF